MKPIDYKKDYKNLTYVICVASLFMFLLLTFFSGCSNAPTTPSAPTLPQQQPEPKPEAEEIKPIKLGKKVSLWSTYYFTPQFSSDSSGYVLRDKDNRPITKPLRLDFWCFIGLQGTGVVDGEVVTFSRTTSSYRVPCENSFMRSLSYARATGKIKYYKDNTKYGHGNRSNPLTPFKSMACDQSIYKYGQRFFIPSAKGATLPDGKIHDGVFVCEDVGGAVKGNHIDTFIGLVPISESNFKSRYSFAYRLMPIELQSYIKSSSSKTFTAYLLED